MNPRCDSCGSDFFSMDDLVSLCPGCLLSGALGDQLTLAFRKTDETFSSGSGTSGAPATPLSFVDIEKLREAFPELEIVEMIRCGGMGAVFKARQTSLDRLVALKILNPALAEASEFQERFEREAKTMALLNHPNIVTIYEFGDRDGFHYLSMEYVEGSDLRNWISDGDLSLNDTLQLIPQICDALAFAHEKGAVHRDVKPGNILVDTDGRVKMTDFGLAKLIRENTDVDLTMEGTVMGTPHYVAPEQLKDAAATDHRSDIYALGVVVYEMLTGKVPTGNYPEPSEVLSKRNRRLDRAVMRAMDQSPEKRFSTVQEFSDSITDCTGGLRAFPLSERFRKRTSRSGFVKGVAAVSVLAALLSAIYFLLPPGRTGAPVSTSGGTGQPPKRAESPFPQEGRRPPVVNMEGRKGTLHGWSHGKRELDISPSAGIRDFVRIGRITRSNYPWIAYRSDTAVVSESPLLDGRNLIAATPTMFITGARMLAHGGVDSRSYLPPSKRWNAPIVDVVEAIAAGLMLTETGKVSILARERWIETHPEIVKAVHAAENIVRFEMKEETAVLIAADGSVVSWNGVLGLLPDPPGAPIIREAACGTNHVFGLTEDGEIVGWAHPHSASFTKKEFTVEAMKIPRDLGKSIAIRGAKFVAAAQQEDYTWRAWGVDFGTGLIRKINSLGPTGDLDFFLDTRGECRLLWIEPKGN